LECRSRICVPAIGGHLVSPTSIHYHIQPLPFSLLSAPKARQQCNTPKCGPRSGSTRRPTEAPTRVHMNTLASGFLRQEFSKMIEAGQWLAVPYSVVHHLENLRLSLSGVVPQRDRRPRPIVDYTYSDVNNGTLSVAPDLIQFGTALTRFFGTALTRFLQHLERADTQQGPIYLSKTDITDAFMRVWIALESIPILGAILPMYPDEEAIVAFPMILPMGWVDSPSFLCALTETIADLTNTRTSAGNLATIAHHLDDAASTRPPATPAKHPSPTPAGVPPPTTRSMGPLKPPMTYTDVYMDNFLMSTQLKNQKAVRSTLFECIDAVLRPLVPTDNPSREEPISTKKLQKGDASWSTKKPILGWLVDTTKRTVELPPHRMERLQEILASVPPHQCRMSQRMVLAIPGGHGLFSQLQSVLLHLPKAKPSDQLRLDQPVHDQLDDIRWLADNLRDPPTRWAEIIDSAPAFLGTVDASGQGMGGVWISADDNDHPILWRLEFPASVQSCLVTYNNPSGNLTNSNLEQLALMCHPDILACEHKIRERSICILSDNTAAVSREHCKSTSTDAPAAYLCRIASLHQRENRYRLTSAYLPGVLNVMADDVSQRWDLPDSQLLHYFNSSYPQAYTWKLCTLRSTMNSSAIQALSMKWCNPASLMAETLQPPHTGANGKTFVNNLDWRPSLPKMPIQFAGSRHSRQEYETAGFPPPITHRNCNSGVSRRIRGIGAHNGWIPQPASHPWDTHLRPTVRSPSTFIPKNGPSPASSTAHPVGCLTPRLCHRACGIGR
jgi:hypothetical protein